MQFSLAACRALVALAWTLAGPISVRAAEPVQTAQVHSASALRAIYGRKSHELAHSPLKRPVLLSSAELPQGLQGEIYAVVEQPLAAVHSAFNSPAQWCEVLLLHINNRRCQATEQNGRHQITLGIVRRYDKPVEEAFDLPFDFKVVQARADYLEVRLDAETGPLGTSNYNILLEAVALDSQRSFLHFSYSYEQNMMVALAIQAYLATFGSDKVGFTELGRTADGKPDYIAGSRGLVERNAMRYFLTLEAFLAGGDAETRRQAWFTGTERYPRQLREIDRETYLGLKRADAARPKTTPP